MEKFPCRMRQHPHTTELCARHASSRSPLSVHPIPASRFNCCGNNTVVRSAWEIFREMSFNAAMTCARTRASNGFHKNLRCAQNACAKNAGIHQRLFAVGKFHEIPATPDPSPIDEICHQASATLWSLPLCFVQSFHCKHGATRIAIARKPRGAYIFLDQPSAAIPPDPSSSIRASPNCLKLAERVSQSKKPNTFGQSCPLTETAAPFRRRAQWRPRALAGPMRPLTLKKSRRVLMGGARRIFGVGADPSDVLAITQRLHQPAIVFLLIRRSIVSPAAHHVRAVFKR